MADFVFNVGKARAGELFNRVENNDPSTSAIILVPLSASGTAAQGRDLATLAAIEADANFAEQTAGGWGREVLTDTELAAANSEVDHANDRWDVSLPQIDWGSPTAGNDTTGVVVCYDANTGAGADSDIIPLVHLDFIVETDGSNVVSNAGDILRAS